MNTNGPPMVISKAAPRTARKEPEIAVKTKTTPPALNNSINELLRDPNGAGSASRSGGSPSPLGTHPAVRRLPAAFSAKELGAAEAKQGFQKAAVDISNKNALEATYGPPQGHPSGGAQTAAINLAATVAGPPHAGYSPRTPPDIQKLIEDLEKCVKHLSQSIAIYKLGSPEPALSEGGHRATLETISSRRNDVFEYILSEEERLGEIKEFLKGIESKEKEIVKDLEAAAGRHGDAKEDEGEMIVPKEAGKTADEERARPEEVRREKKRLEEVHIEQDCVEKERIEWERIEQSRMNKDNEHLRQELLEKETLSKERIEKGNSEKAVHLQQAENERLNKELIVNVINTALTKDQLDKREELRASAEARELARLQGEILGENRRKKRIEKTDDARLSHEEGEAGHPAIVQLLEKSPNVESSTLAGVGGYSAPFEPQENARNAVPKALSSPPPFPYRVEIQLRPLFE